MALGGNLRINIIERTGVGAAIAGLGTCTLMLIDYWSFRANGPSQTQTVGLAIGLMMWVAIGATAGLVSGRLRDAPASWVAALVGTVLAYWIFYTALFPGSRYPGEDGFEGDIALVAAFLLPLIAGGHLLGAFASRALRRTGSAPIVG